MDILKICFNSIIIKQINRNMNITCKEKTVLPKNKIKPMKCTLQIKIKYTGQKNVRFTCLIIKDEIFQFYN